MEYDDALSTWTWATMAGLFWDGDRAFADSTAKRRAELIARDTLIRNLDSLSHLRLARHMSPQGLWDAMQGDTARASAAARWLRRNGHPLAGDFVDMVMASRAGRPDAETLRSRIDSVAFARLRTRYERLGLVPKRGVRVTREEVVHP